MQRITFNTSTHYTLHIYTPVGFALFCLVLLCFPFKVCVSSVRDLSHPAKNMSHKTEHVGRSGNMAKFCDSQPSP